MMSLKAKLTALLSLIVLLAVLAPSSVYLSNFIQREIADVGSRGEFIAMATYLQAETALSGQHMPPGSNPNDFDQLQKFVHDTLVGSAAVQSQLLSAVGYSKDIYYVAITDTSHRVIVHDDPGMISHQLPAVPPFSQVLNASIRGQLRVIYGPQQAYEVVLPLTIGNRPLGDVRVGVLTLFLRDDINPALRRAIFLSAGAIVIGTLFAGALCFGLLRPLETISRSVDRMARGEYSESIHLDRHDEWGILSSKLNLLGEQMRGEKAAFVALKDNLGQLFSNLTDGLLLFDAKDQVLLATPAVARFLGRSPRNLIHRSAMEVFAPASPLHSFLRDVFRAGKPAPWRILEMPEDWPVRRVAVSAQLVDEQGRRVASLVTLRDAGTRAELEDQIDVTAKLAALGKLMSGVAHEVKNPLNAMVLQLEILKTKLTDQSAAQPQIEVLTAEVRRLDRVVKTFLDFTRQVEIRRAETDVESLVREVLTLAEPQARQNRVRLVLNAQGRYPHLWVDRDLVKQALLNLVLNGCQAMPEGGELTVRPHALGTKVQVEIIDQGVGIPPEKRDRIFSLFYTTKPGGTGVGLAMTLRIVQLHNGTIDFTSEVNHGTAFRVCLPTATFHESAVASELESQASEAPDREEMKPV
jgi:signal transduction histidine kinase